MGSPSSMSMISLSICVGRRPLSAIFLSSSGSLFWMPHLSISLSELGTASPLTPSRIAAARGSPSRAAAPS
eukprot:6649192-Prymnesium_polylepis.2